MNWDILLLAAVVTVGIATVVLLELARRQAQAAWAARFRRGPIVVCLDRSASMYGQLGDWCSLLVLELMHEARARKRDFHVLYFNQEVVGLQYVAHGVGQLEKPPEPYGGTAFLPVLREAVGRCVHQSNIVVITDGMGERDPQLPTSNVDDLRVTAVEIAFDGHRWPLPFADEMHVVDGRDLPHPSSLVRRIARRAF